MEKISSPCRVPTTGSGIGWCHHSVQSVTFVESSGWNSRQGNCLSGPVAKRVTAGGDAAVESLVNKSASALVGSERLASKAGGRSIKRTVPRR